MRRTLIVSLSLLALAGCGRKDAQEQKQQPQDSAFTAEPAQQAQAPADGAAAPASCGVLPSRDAVARAIKDALAQIYGPDSMGTKVTVVTLTPDGGCKTVAVAYKASGTAASAPMTRDGGKWVVTLYNKPYPVQ